jgi:hypothetical protein
MRLRPLEESEVALADGVRIACVSMEKSIDSVVGANDTPKVVPAL